MTPITYAIAPHDVGWDYRLGEVFSETVASHDAAIAAGDDRPTTHVVDTP